MKKIISSLLIVFLLTICFDITNVLAYKSASECRTPGVEGCSCSVFSRDNCTAEVINGQKVNYTHYDENGNVCAIVSGGQCGIADNGNTVNGKVVEGNDTKTESEIPSFLEEQKTVSCGHIKSIPEYIPFITNLTINIFTIISVGMLVIMGTIDLFQGIVSGKEDVMKKNQKAFFGRLTSAILLFLLVALTKLFVSFIASVTGGGFGIAECVDCFINNSCS